jgi:hypothetical protein
MITLEPPVQKQIPLKPRGVVEETQLSVRPTLEPDYDKEAGGDQFTAQFSRSKVRFEYQGEWIQYEHLNQAPALSSSAVSDNRMSYSNAWKDTDLTYVIRPFGLKTIITLKSDQAPTTFQFKVSKSAGWDDSKTLPYSLSDGKYNVPIPGLQTETVGDTITVTLPDLTGREFPVILDPTFSIAALVDDTYAYEEVAPDTGDINAYTGYDYVQFGRFQLGVDGDCQSYLRWDVEIPRGSKITASHVTFKAQATASVTYNTNVKALSQAGSPAWRETGASGGFHTDNYSNGSALNTITPHSGSVSWAVTAWTVDNTYDTPDLSSILQTIFDTINYNPNDSEGSYVGIVVEDGDGAYAWPAPLRLFYSYYSSGTTAELDITFDPWGQVRTGNGFKYDATAGVYVYFDTVV